MKEDIEAFKQQNGNITYSVKELIGALHTKLDRGFTKVDTCLDQIHTRLAEGDSDFARIKNTLLYYKIGFGLVFACLGYLLFT